MNNRICSVIAVAALMTLNTGCRGMNNFLFGRGARCGSCNTLANVPAPQFGNVMQAPCGQTPYVQPASPCQTPQYAAPAYQGGVVIAPSTGCGCNNYANSAHVPNACGSCEGNYGSAYAGDCGCMANTGCGCGGAVNGYGAVDPYMSGEIIGTPYEGQIIDGQSVPSGTPIQSDDFRARKVDNDGNRILWEEPLPSGSTPL